MSDRLANKVALVTGGGSGIGRATAVALARQGARVVVADRAAGEGQATVQLITDAGGSALFIKADVAEAEQVLRLVEQTVAHFGRLDIAHNNAGIQGDFADTADYSESAWARTIGVNLTGVFLCMKHELAQMKRQGGGVIVNTASVLGLVGARGHAAYVASKHGIIGLTKTAALEYASLNIRVNAVCPGFTDTPMVERAARYRPDDASKLLDAVPMQKLVKPEEVAEAVLYLASDAATAVTGQTLVIDGGWVAQ